MRSSVFANVKDIDMRTGGGPPVPRNVYEMAVESAESADTSNGDPALSLWAAVVADHTGDPEHEGHTVPMWLKTDGYKSDKEAQMAKAKLKALGINTDMDQDDQQIAAGLGGKRFFAELKLEDASHKDEASGQIVPTFEDMPGGGQRRAKRNVIGSMWSYNPKAPRDEAPAQPQQQFQAAVVPQQAPQGYAPQQPTQAPQQPFYQQQPATPMFAPQNGPPPPYPPPPAPPLQYGQLLQTPGNSAPQVPQQARRGAKR